MGRGFDERGGAHDGSLSRQFWYVCRHASCTYTCTRRTLAEHFCQSVCIRCAAQCSLCGDDSFGFVFSYELLQTQSVYVWLLNTTGMGGFMCWLGIGLSHWRFRRGMQKQGYDLNLLPYRSPVFPLGTLYAFAVCLVVALGQNTEAVFNGDWLGVLPPTSAF